MAYKYGEKCLHTMAVLCKLITHYEESDHIMNFNNTYTYMGYNFVKKENEHILEEIGSLQKILFMSIILLIERLFRISSQSCLTYLYHISNYNSVASATVSSQLTCLPPYTDILVHYTPQ